MDRILIENVKQTLHRNIALLYGLMLDTIYNRRELLYCMTSLKRSNRCNH